ncbi:MAG: cobalt ECF transporter T component CbiQ [Thermodesulfobacteriota bacterium]|nr:cobalt ECF transporter T component CbiQ [Thermodesulfobacteriota bacterium]
MIGEEFASGDSYIHRLDPRMKILIAVSYAIVIAVSDKLPVLLCGLFFPVVLVAIARLNMKKVLFRLLIVNGFIFLLWIFLPFTYPGKPFFSIGPLTASWEGTVYASMITIKSNAIILASIVLLATSSITTLVHALKHLYVPEKLIHIFFFCYRYIHVIHLEYLKLTHAMKIRCFTPKTNMHTYRTYAYLVGILLLRSYDRSQRVYDAMLCRGFKGKFWMLDHFELKKSDMVSGSVMTLYIIGLVILQWGRIIA